MACERDAASISSSLWLSSSGDSCGERQRQRCASVGREEGSAQRFTHSI